MSFISNKISVQIATLKNEFNVNKKIEHQGIKGGFNENELSLLLKGVIPRRYEITKGIIENSIGEQSNETDLIIYDDEILPPYIKDDLSFIPVESVKYAIEVKSCLNSTELKSTIKKFKQFGNIGGTAPTVLFAYSSDIDGNEIVRYYKNDNDFMVSPKISVLCVSNKCYYFKSVETNYLRNFLTNSDLINAFKESSGLDFNASADMLRTTLNNDAALDLMSRSSFAHLIQSVMIMNEHTRNIDHKEFNINGVNFNDITFKIHKWIGIEVENNDVELSLLSGISNTLSKENFGNYLLNGKVIRQKLISICFEDMWGNLSGSKFDKDGLMIESNNNVSFNFQTNKETSKITFEMK
ncbi:hypothetical protein V8095_003609 [Vibrio parahaemolyticus]